MHSSRHVTFSSPVQGQPSALLDISNRWGCLFCLKPANLMFYLDVMKWQHQMAFALLGCRQTSPSRKGHSELPMVKMSNEARTL